MGCPSASPLGHGGLREMLTVDPLRGITKEQPVVTFPGWNSEEGDRTSAGILNGPLLTEEGGNCFFTCQSFQLSPGVRVLIGLAWLSWLKTNICKALGTIQRARMSRSERSV